MGVGRGFRIIDGAASKSDELREKNFAEYRESRGPQLFNERWSSPLDAEYSREFAEKFGGVLR